MINNLTLDSVLHIYEKEISKNIKNKSRLYKFELNKIENISDIIKCLNEGKVGHERYNIFLIFEPKERLVMSLSVMDKVINHFLTRYILEMKLTKYLDDRNCATRKNMGTDYAIRLLKKYLELNKKYTTFYILKIDISKYFYSIDHETLKALLKGKIDDYEYMLISKVIDSTNKDYINKEITSIMLRHKTVVPLYDNGKGLPIGNMTSQFLSIFYLYELDHYIVHDLGLKYYVRYMDDFAIISHDINKLKDAKEKIIDILEKKYKLNCNLKKTMIINVKDGFGFLGYSFKVRDKKTIIKVKSSNYNKIKRRLKEVKYNLKKNNIGVNKAFCTVMTYSNCYHFADNTKVLKLIDKYFYEE